MANRYDGVDFVNEESRMLFIYNLPKFTNIQEKFLTNKMCAAILYNERVRTRIIQAVGRCTRSSNDYAVVCIFGDYIRNELVKADKQSLYPPELRAELKFGVEQSSSYESIDDMIEQVTDFIGRTDVWQDAEDNILKLKNKYSLEDKDDSSRIYDLLGDMVKHEVDYQYKVWKKDYMSAFSEVKQIIDKLNIPELRGYKCFWQYIAGSLAYKLYATGNKEYKEKSIRLFRDALNADIKIHWLANLLKETDVEEKSIKYKYVDDIFENFEENLDKNSTPKKFNKMLKDITDNIHSKNGTKFENGHKNLGTLLGYKSYNSEDKSAPDPYWIINSKLCIVAEDKLYEDDIKKIPTKHIREARTHEDWIRKNVSELDDDCEILTIFISNSCTIEKDAIPYTGNIYHVELDKFINFADDAVAFVRSVNDTFTETGNYLWRSATKASMQERKVTPDHFIELVKKKKMSELH